MTNKARGEVWYEGGHVEGGFEVLKGSGHLRSEVLTASAGYSDAGEPQVLVLGHSNLEILSGGGDLHLDVGDREVRAVRPVEGSGIEVCITRMGVSGLRPTRWMHRISDADARYLEQSWLDSSPFMHSGTQLNPLPWREEEYAYYVGRVVTEASRCDVALVALVLLARALLGRPDGAIYGASGEQLADALDELGALSPALADIGERYRAWYRQRNFASHGIRGRDAAGRPTGQVFKAKRGRRLTPEVAVEIEDQDFRELALVWRAFYALNHDAFDATIHVSGRGDPEDVLARIPMPNSVSATERLPSDAQSGKSAQ